MPTIEAARLQEIAAQLLIAAGASDQEAGVVSSHSIGANLAGHDSHGIILIPTYLDRIKRGHIVPGAPFEVVQETSNSTVIDGNWGFGYVVSERAMAMTRNPSAAKRRTIAEPVPGPTPVTIAIGFSDIDPSSWLA